jgi:hypothetical protein
MLKTITLFSFVLLCEIINAQNIAFPLKASTDKKYLVDQNNKPVFLNGCSAWHMTYAVSYDEAKAFLLRIIKVIIAGNHLHNIGITNRFRYLSVLV